MITLGRRTEEGELHVPEGAEVEIVETDRGGKSTYHGPGQLVCYPIFDLTRHGQDVKRYCRDLEEALIRTLAAVGRRGDADRGADRDLGRDEAGAEEDRLDRRPHHEVGDDARLRVERRPRHGAVHRVDHRVRPRGRVVHDDRRELGRPITVDEVRPHAAAAFAEVFDLSFEELPADEGAGLWPQPLHERLTGSRPKQLTPASRRASNKSRRADPL